MTRLIRSELLKLRTTNMWWIFLLASLVFTGLALYLTYRPARSAKPALMPAQVPAE